MILEGRSGTCSPFYRNQGSEVGTKKFFALARRFVHRGAPLCSPLVSPPVFSLEFPSVHIQMELPLYTTPLFILPLCILPLYT